MLRIRNRKQDGFTLVELMIVVAIIGILAVLAVYGVTRYMKNAKTGEARNSLGQLAKAAVGAYEEERSDGVLIAPGTSGAASLHAVCTSATPVPAALGSVSNKKYQSSTTDWNPAGLTKNDGWRCLKFQLTEPQYFQYGYVAGTGASWIAWADGDLSGTGSGTADMGFHINGKLAGSPLQMTVAPNITETEGPSLKVP